MIKSTHSKYEFMEKLLTQRTKEDRLRTLKPLKPISAQEVMIKDRKLISFCSNDYLGLSKHPLLKERSKQWVEEYGNGATASRLICGDFEGLEQLEVKLAKLKSTETALILNSGFQTNITLIPALADSNTLILSDELNHNSIVQGCILSRCTKIVFRHNDIEHLRELLKENKQCSRILIITETIFSMDGDACDLVEFNKLAKEYNALLIVDEAHATGTFGENGMGIATGGDADIIIGTFGKACGSFGSYIACNQTTRDYLINYCTGLVFSTALPPAVLGSIDAALDLIPTMQSDRKALMETAEYVRNSLANFGYETGQSVSQIIPVIIGDEVETMKLAKWLDDNNVLASAIRPPTVPEGTSRIRLALSSAHTKSQIEYLLKLFKDYADAH